MYGQWIWHLLYELARLLVLQMKDRAVPRIWFMPPRRNITSKTQRPDAAIDAHEPELRAAAVVSRNYWIKPTNYVYIAGSFTDGRFARSRYKGNSPVLPSLLEYGAQLHPSEPDCGSDATIVKQEPATS